MTVEDADGTFRITTHAGQVITEVARTSTKPIARFIVPKPRHRRKVTAGEQNCVHGRDQAAAGVRRPLRAALPWHGLVDHLRDYQLVILPMPDRTATTPATRRYLSRYWRGDPSGVVTLRMNGRLHHIGIGRTHARTHVILLVDDLHVRVVDAATGELLRELTVDPARDYQRQANPNKTKPPNP